ncbi:hypothetical protein [Azorhizobium caulinodans]|uniref:Uncharacterized protein n=1 Tax=Azorhizobium caulinodans (strain ATCC 43989 / DSM 5975 / JCM 20966 / LMG 6465 / NBRC 14845 / NCIMB 13405 / ORS 571) TaxID=438753 RepID=A8INS9_AZOC5|nr:hypothetical protein [Azorhizobium caulinodans]BAF89783.1 unknown protein [Azorhizobium caulinodans ORS 571]
MATPAGKRPPRRRRPAQTPVPEVPEPGPVDAASIEKAVTDNIMTALRPLIHELTKVVNKAKTESPVPPHETPAAQLEANTGETLEFTKSLLADKMQQIQELQQLVTARMHQRRARSLRRFPKSKLS